MNPNLKDQEVLLAVEKDSTKPKIVTGINEDGTLQTTKPQKKNQPDFLKIDKHSDALENFMSNFIRQSKNPTHFQFFKVPIEAMDNIVNVISSMLKDPENPSNKTALDEMRVLPETTKKQYQAIDKSKIDWSQFEKLGIKREMIDNKTLNNLLNWQKTPTLLPIKAEIGDTIIRTDARLSLRETPEGKLNLIVHAVRKEPQLDGFVYGTRLTNEDKQNLRQTGHAGRLVEIEPVKDQKLGAEVKPDNASKTQVAVNSEGKTNEATRNIKEPLKQGQTAPTEKQEQKQEQKQTEKNQPTKKLKKSKGRKM